MHINLSKILIFIGRWAHWQRINWLLNMLLFLRTLTHSWSRIYYVAVFFMKLASTLKQIIAHLSILYDYWGIIPELFTWLQELLACVIEGTISDQRISNCGYVTLLLHIIIGCLLRVPINLYRLIILSIWLSWIFLWWSFYI